MTRTRSSNQSRVRSVSSENWAQIAQSWPVGKVWTGIANLHFNIRGSGVMVYLDDTESSYIDLQNPAHLEFEYHQYMTVALQSRSQEPEPVRALHLGACACCLARAWDFLRPGSRQCAVEIDPLLASNVRSWFALPKAPGLSIRMGEAGQTLASYPKHSWPWIIRDVFEHGRTPAALASPEHFQQVKRVLTRDGTYLANIALGSQGWTRGAAGQVAAQARQEMDALKVAGLNEVVAISDRQVWRGKRVGNIVIAASSLAWDMEALELGVRRLPLPAEVFKAQ